VSDDCRASRRHRTRVDAVAVGPTRPYRRARIDLQPNAQCLLGVEPSSRRPGNHFPGAILPHRAKASGSRPSQRHRDVEVAARCGAGKTACCAWCPGYLRVTEGRAQVLGRGVVRRPLDRWMGRREGTKDRRGFWSICRRGASPPPTMGFGHNRWRDAIRGSRLGVRDAPHLAGDNGGDYAFSPGSKTRSPLLRRSCGACCGAASASLRAPSVKRCPGLSARSGVSLSPTGH
jgi:hypothetical protein